MQTMQEYLLTKGILPNLFAGVVSWRMTLIAGISYATLTFSGSLSGYLNPGICSALVSPAVAGFIVAWQSSAPFIIAGPDANKQLASLQE